MDEGLKQRLIGAFVLLALGVIFVPVLFESDYRNKVDRTTQIPPAPEVGSVVIAEPEPAPEIESAPPPEQMYSLSPAGATDGPAAVRDEAPGAAAAPAPVRTPDRDILDSKGVAKAWAVQVASFSEPERATALRDKLLDAGHPAFSRAGSGNLTRVYVGPKIDRHKAEQLKQELDRELQLQTMVVRFAP